MNRPASPANLAGGGAPAVQLRSYDVLLLPTGDVRRPLVFAPGNDVGNSRFRVLLALFRHRYRAARDHEALTGDDGPCRAVAADVISTVCDRCVPNGRFFEQDGRGGWRQFERTCESTVQMVHRALELEPIESTPPLERIEPAPEAVLSQAQDGAQDVFQTSSGFLEMLCDAAEGKSPAPEEIVSRPGPFDVVCDPDGQTVSADRKCTGNNRLKVLLAIRMRAYKSASRDHRTRIAAEVASSILDDAAGHFLRFRDASGGYVPLSCDDAAACARRAFEAATKTARKAAKKRRRRTRDGLSEVQRLLYFKNKRANLQRAEKNSRKGGGFDNVNVFGSGFGFGPDAVVPDMAFSALPALPEPEHHPVVPKAA